jgi:hypothetical protein
MTAITFGLLALGWAFASWVYFDATERGKPYAFLWGLAVLFLGWTLIPQIVYLSVRNQPPRFEVADRVATRQYLVTTVFTSMALTVAAAATALAAALVWGQFCGMCGTPSQPDDQFCRACGTRLTAPSSATTAA